MAKYTVLSFLFGDYDTFKDPEEVDPEATYVCITDRQDLISNIWNIVYEPNLNTDEFTGVQKSLFIKYNKLFDYIEKDSEYLVRLDMSIQIHKSLQPIIQYMKLNNYDCLLQCHNTRNDTIDEYNAWMKYRNQDPMYKDIFIRKMFELGYDINMPGLLGATFQIYKLIPEVISFVKDADNIINKTSNYCDNNDQCYYTYALYKNWGNFKVLFTNIQILASSYMDYCYHGTNEPVFKNHKCGEGYNIYQKKIVPLFDTFVNIKYFE